MNIIRSAFVALLFLCTISIHAQVTVKYSSATGDPGNMVTIEVRTDNFNDIASMQFSTNWNASVLEYVSVGNFNSTLGLNESLFGTPNNLPGDNAVTVTWFDVSLEGVTLPANTLLFSITFEIIGSAGSSTSLDMTSTPTTISFQDGSGANVASTYNAGTVTVNGMSGGGDLELIASEELAGAGTNVCVDISVNGFSEIFSAQWNQTYDPAVLDFTGIENINLTGLNAGLFNVNETTGEIRMSYVAPPPSVTVPNGTVIYQLCFDVIGAAGTTTPVNFTALPGNPIEIIQIQGGSDVPVTPDIDNGSVTINNQGGADDLILSFPEVVVPEDGSICVPINAQNINDIQAIQNLAFFWDPNVLEYTGVMNENLCGGIPNDLTLVETDVAMGELSMFYVFVDPGDGSGCTVPDAPFFEICFNVIGECDAVSPLTFGTSGGAVLVFDSQGNGLPYSTNEGSVTIECSSCDPVVSVSNVSCKGGDDGSITLDLDNCDDVTNVNPSMADLMELTAGMYDVTITYDNGDRTLVLEDIEVTEPAEIITLESSTITPDCDGTGGGIDIEISGLIGDATYAWSTGQNTQDIMGQLCQGDIRVTITDSQNPTCPMVFGPFAIPCSPMITGTVSNVSCNGDNDGGVDITVEGGTGDYTYEWSCSGTVNGDGDITGLEPGMCTVTVTDNTSGCTGMQTFEIQEPSALVITDINVVADTAGGNTGAIDLVVTGGTGDYTYIWNVALPDTPNVEDLPAGTYSVVVRDENGCTVNTEVIVPAYEFLEVVGTVLDPLCFGEQSGVIDITVTGGTPDYMFEWSCPGTVAGDGDLTGVGSGSCTVTVTDADGVMVTETFDIDQPNPLSAAITVEEICDGTTIANASIEVVGGTEQYSIEWNTNPIQIGDQAFDLEEGPVSALVTDANNCTFQATAEVASCIDPADCYKATEAITPNEDGKNEVLVILCIDNNPNRLQIFNEQGQLVYTADNYQNNWNGVNDGGDEVIDDVYLWVLEIFLSNGDRRIERGTVAVLRNLNK